MKHLISKLKGWLGSAWNRVLDHYICVCSVLILTICFFGYTLKLSADYEKELNNLVKSHIEAVDLINLQSEVIEEQGDALGKQGDALGKQDDALGKQDELINKLVNLLNQQKATIEYQNRVIEELIKRLKDNGLWPDEPKRNRSEASWTLYESS